ncbi:MAG TPA: DUF924 family protein [Steroidobacteraceae bacterium]|nr:DUF924 family protein [Steroidobacteraceae bacterium]
MDEARAVREYWFGTEPLTREALDRRMDLWFGSDARQDEEIRVRFGGLLERAAAGELSAWADGPRRRLSLIVLLDQFPRNMFRGTARAFEYDAQALALALTGMQSGADGALDFVERLFFYMPLEHAENRDAQDESVAAFRRLLAEVPAELHEPFAGMLRFAEQHRSIIERFGRFPHRNVLLGRASTPEEVEWLKEGGTSFGQ